MKLAIQERLLPGGDISQKLDTAKALGINFVEFDAAGLDERLSAIAEALELSGIGASGINMGRDHGCLAADAEERNRAADGLREAMTCALDLEADYVCFAPGCGNSDLPDLLPFASTQDLQRELLIWLLRGMSDLADAMDARLALLPLNHYESGFINRLEQAAHFRRQVDDHPMITVAASMYHMALEERDLLASLRTHLEDISVIYLTDSNGLLPGRGFLPFAAFAQVLRDAGYAGWLTLAADNGQADELAACLRFLGEAGLRD